MPADQRGIQKTGMRGQQQHRPFGGHVFQPLDLRAKIKFGKGADEQRERAIAKT